MQLCKMQFCSKMLHVICISQAGESWKIWVPVIPTGAGGGQQGLEHTFHCRANEPLGSVLLIATAVLSSWGISGAETHVRIALPLRFAKANTDVTNGSEGLRRSPIAMQSVTIPTSSCYQWFAGSTLPPSPRGIILSSPRRNFRSFTGAAHVSLRRIASQSPKSRPRAFQIVERCRAARLQLPRLRISFIEFSPERPGEKVPSRPAGRHN